MSQTSIGPSIPCAHGLLNIGGDKAKVSDFKGEFLNFYLLEPFYRTLFGAEKWPRCIMGKEKEHVKLPVVLLE